MCNKEHLVGYVYDELSSADTAAFEAHVQACAECRRELGELRQTRQHLTAWSPPEPDFNFTIVQTTRSAAPGRAAPRWISFVPQWGLAAAAALIVLAGAAAIANIEVRYEQDGSLVVRTGWASRPPGVEPDAQNPAQAQAGDVAAASEQVKTEMTALQARLDGLEQVLQQMRGEEQPRVASAVRQGMSPSDVRKIVAESEARQRADLTVRIAALARDINTARVDDYRRLQQTFSEVRGVTTRQLQQQRDIDSLRYMQTVLHQNQK